MSYNVCRSVNTGGEEWAQVSQARGSAPYSYAPLFRHALGGNGLWGLCGLPGTEASDRLAAAVRHMKDPDNLRDYLETNDSLPPGWRRNAHSDLIAARNFLQDALDACREHPKAMVSIG